jgi:hypothetical protein
MKQSDKKHDSLPQISSHGSVKEFQKIWIRSHNSQKDGDFNKIIKLQPDKEIQLDKLCSKRIRRIKWIGLY